MNEWMKGKSWKVFLVHATKAYVENEVQLQLFLTLAVDGAGS